MKKMLLNKERLIIERQQRAWSQSQLAEVSAVSLRTIQRIEKNGKASLESTKAIAAAFDLKITDFYIPATSSAAPSVAATALVVSRPASIVPRQTRQGFCLLTSLAKTIAMSFLLLSTLVLLFMSWTGIPNLIWIIEFRDTVFSEHLPSTILNTITTVLIMISTLTVATIIGLCFDAIRNQGLYLYLKDYLQSDDFSINNCYLKSRQTMATLARFLLKVCVVSSTIILIAAGLIYVDMEDYQKNNMTRFIEKHF